METQEQRKAERSRSLRSDCLGEQQTNVASGDLSRSHQARIWDGKKMPKNLNGNIACLAKRVCGFYNEGKKSYTEPRIEIVVLGKKKVEFKPK